MVDFGCGTYVSQSGAEKAVPCWSDRFAGGVAVEPGGCVVAHGRQLQVAVLLFQAAEREVLALPLSSSVLFFFFLFFRCQVVSPFVLPVYFFLKFPPLFQASPYSFLPLSILFPLFLFSPSSLPFSSPFCAGVGWYL